MPLILVDLLFFTGAKGGMETYVRELYKELGAVDSGHRFVALASRELSAMDHSWFPGRVVNSGISGENRTAWAWGEITAVARAASSLDADLIHAPANIGPWRSRVPVVLTVHDLLPFRFPKLAGTVNSLFVRLLVRFASRAATRIITDSAASAVDILRLLPVTKGELDVVPLAAGTAEDSKSPARDAAVRPLLLSTGNRLPHKNFETLLRALALIDPAERPDLVITGSHGDDPLRPLVEDLGLRDSVRLASWVLASELEELYALASVYVIPSLFEGFGLPVLEAMVRGCPVISSDIPVLREVGGDAALYVDATDAEALASAIRSVLDDVDVRRRLSAAGRARASEFSWAKVARETSRTFDAVLAPGRSSRRSDPHEGVVG